MLGPGVATALVKAAYVGHTPTAIALLEEKRAAAEEALRAAQTRFTRLQIEAESHTHVEEAWVQARGAARLSSMNAGLFISRGARSTGKRPNIPVRRLNIP